MYSENQKPTGLEALEDLAERAAARLTKIEEQIDAKIGAVYKPMGSVQFGKLAQPSKELLGNVYNVTDAFTADDKFIEGENGNTYPAGTNVVVVSADDTYKYDVLSGMVDLSNYVTKSGSKQLSDENYTAAEKAKLAAVAAEATKVAKSTTAGNILINGVETPVVTFATEEEVTAMLDRVLPLEE